MLVEIERLASAGKTLAAGQVERTNGWRAGGHRSAEAWLAHEEGSSVSSASEVLATASRMEQLPSTEEALRSGKLSSEQVAAVSSASTADPAAESRLLSEAAKETLSKLRRQAQAVRQAAQGRNGASDRDRIHRSRYFRHWTAADGAVEGRFRLTADQGAVLLAGIATCREQVYCEARRQGVRDESDAYEADALVEMARAPRGTATGGPQTTINIRVDRSALLRGHTEPGEVCEIVGVGPVPVETVRKAECDAVLKALLVDGDRVLDVRHVGRTVPANVRIALEERDRACVVPGCDRSRHLETHHLVPFSQGGPTTLENLSRICGYHHDQISYQRARLSGPFPFWHWEDPPCPAGVGVHNGLPIPKGTADESSSPPNGSGAPGGALSGNSASSSAGAEE